MQFIFGIIFVIVLFMGWALFSSEDENNQSINSQKTVEIHQVESESARR